MKVKTFVAPDLTVVDVKERFVKWVAWLDSVDALYHLDDSPHDIIATLADEPLFTKEVADQVEKTVGEFRDLLGEGEMWAIYYPITQADASLRHLQGE